MYRPRVWKRADKFCIFYATFTMNLESYKVCNIIYTYIYRTFTYINTYRKRVYDCVSRLFRFISTNQPRLLLQQEIATDNTTNVQSQRNYSCIFPCKIFYQYPFAPSLVHLYTRCANLI